MLADIGLCHRKGYWAWLRHKKPSTESIHLVAGSAYARGLEVARERYYSHDPRYYPDIRLCLPDAWRAAVTAWGNYVPDPTANKQLARVLEAIHQYFIDFSPAVDHLQPYFAQPNKPAVEFTFAVPLPDCIHPVTGNPILYTGRTDLIGIMADNLYLLDDKTASQLGAHWPKQWDLRGQFLGYMYAARQLLPMPVAGIAVRAMCFRAKGYETAEKIVHFSQWQVDEWLLAAIRKVQRWIEAWQEQRWDKSFGEPCNMYSGCPFRDLCIHRDPEPWLAGNYQEFVWNPLTLQSTVEEIEP